MSFHSDPRRKKDARRLKAGILRVFINSSVFLMSLGGAVWLFPLIQTYGDQYGEPTPGWMYAVAGVGAYTLGPLMIIFSRMHGWSLGRYGVAVGLTGLAIGLSALHAKSLKDGDLDALSLIFKSAIIGLPQLYFSTCAFACSMTSKNRGSSGHI